jgi:agmatinase
MPHTDLPNPRLSPRFAGLVTFGRYPRLQELAAHSLPADWAIYGVPFDGGVTYRPGARFGPRAVREASQYLKRVHVEHAVDVPALLSLADAGDAPVKPYDCLETLDAVTAFANALGDRATTRLFALGGDHSIAYANLRATCERLAVPNPGLALVHIDAHLDTVDAVWGERWGHASPFRRAVEDGLVDPRAMISLGVRGPLNARDDLDFARTQGVTLLSPSDWSIRGPAALGAFLDSLQGRPVYISLDIDALDPAFAPGTGTPCPGGFTPREVFDLLRRLRGINLVGADLVEVLPDRDPADITSLLAAHLIFEILALDAARRAGAAP